LAGVAIEVLVKKEVILKIRVVLQHLIIAEAGAAAGIRVTQKQLGEAGRERVGHFEQRYIVARVRRVLYFKIVAVVVVKAK
jgi:hypothetical protein